MTDTLKEYHFTDEEIDVLLQALIWTMDNGNYSEREYECARELYVTLYKIGHSTLRFLRSRPHP